MAQPEGNWLMHIIRIRDPQTWDRALLALPNPHVLQSWTWGEFKAQHGWSATRLLFQEDGRTVAAASVLRRKLSLLPVSMLYVPKGPAVNWSDTVVAARVLAEFERLVRRWRVVFCKIDPDVYYPHAERLESLARSQGIGPGGRPANAPAVAHLLAVRDWHFSNEQVQFRNSVLLSLDRPEDDILAAMKQKTRYNIGLAMRRGVTVRPGNAEDLVTFYELYLETSHRDRFPIRPPKYYYDAWGSFLEAGRAQLLLAEVAGEAVAGLMLFIFGPTAWYMYGASSHRHRERMPNYLLQWEAIRRARAAGCSLYDLWGAPDDLDESDPMWGVYRFKLGLGGELVQGLGAWDFPVSQTGYRFFTGILPRYMGLLRAQSQTG
jgi:peptidoglycan pentaglycine glycine transferase (the first glycine)